ncbi:pilus assembly protein PilP [Pseudoalteromonas sp. MMG013]|uniref:Type IV pilus assembly protein PilP n=1 Tax=Pseudoalteromonas aurantia 208 TaxID=1314867 RepID=A0ABR9E753_9GAMM|nr:MULTISPECIES: pilus assembly protein PilP [Pseudoalteromonas]MBE0366572.1 type IV pilus assembly protein PilP [Pseudoalteromonas aurantia 208]MBQ4848002.1 pilus assembly protein PilP [Pseudoalteromonas sp. MMG005]MBQ4863855.1 pilus assembly protein PilP [Pseudoalteromonas sp. MMG013]
MYRLPCLFFSTLLLCACNDDTAEQKEYIDQIQASATPKVEPIPEMREFIHFAYDAENLRSPFVAPEPEVIESKMVQIRNCLHPDPNRARDPLEKYPLDNLEMKGTIATTNATWALIKASDQGLYRIKQGQYMGLYHGEVVSVNPDHIELLELIPDGTGCWKERLTKVEIHESEETGTSE